MRPQRHKYEVVLAPGCHRDPTNPVISWHRTLRAAVAQARTSDRLRVEPADTSVCLYQAKSEQPSPLGYGLHGYPDTRPLRECLAEAEEAERRLRGECPRKRPVTE